jgi:hypothetical protein
MPSAAAGAATQAINAKTLQAAIAVRPDGVKFERGFIWDFILLTSLIGADPFGYFAGA